MFEGSAHVRGTALQHTALRAGDFGELGLGTGRCATRDAELEIAVQIFVRIRLRRVRWTIEGTPAARGASSRKSGECPTLRGRRAYGRLGGITWRNAE